MMSLTVMLLSDLVESYTYEWLFSSELVTDKNDDRRDDDVITSGIVNVGGGISSVREVSWFPSGGTPSTLPLLSKAGLFISILDGSRNPGNSNSYYKESLARAVVVAQLVKRSVPTPEIRGSNPNIGKMLSTNCTLEKTIVKKNKKWLGMAHL